MFLLQGMLPKVSYSTRLPPQIIPHRRSDSRLIRCVCFRLCAFHTGAPIVVPSWLVPFLVGGHIVYYPQELRISFWVRFIVKMRPLVLACPKCPNTRKPCTFPHFLRPFGRLVGVKQTMCKKVMMVDLQSP